MGHTSRNHCKSGSGIHKAYEWREQRCGVGRGGIGPGGVGVSNDGAVYVDVVIVGSVNGRLCVCVLALDGVGLARLVDDTLHTSVEGHSR